MWHFVLNDWYLDDSTNEAESDAADEWFRSLPKDEQQCVKEKSWEKIFEVFPPVDTEWSRRGVYSGSVLGAAPGSNHPSQAFQRT